MKETGPSRMTRGQHLEAHAFHAVSKTLARPSVLLGAAAGGFIGTSSLYVLASYAGFTYSVTTSLLWLCGGAFAGLIIEVLVSLFSRK